ncbi:17 kDa surface antigen [Kordiimonas sediminis]|uniref:17 kDa surface antigen n=2 Tax=Kordiimonas sediminis TaxID=1735581 RepID=A0A919E8D7_9PROT|nr:17 kDa surface antigen [Kordiimonas sediminis]
MSKVTSTSKAFVILACGLSVAACTNEEVGTVIGAATGAVVGNEIGGDAGLVIGAALGGLAGNRIGEKLDERDRLLMERAYQDSLENGRSGHPVEWRNPDNGHRGSFTPYEAYHTNEGDVCRKYEQAVVTGHESQKGLAVACRNKRGKWNTRAN